MSAPPIGAKGTGWKAHLRASSSDSGLLEPAVLHQQVHPAVAVHVADAQPVPERDGGHLLGDRVERPRLERAIGVERGVAEEAVPRADELGPLVAHDVRELRRLVADLVEDLVLRPVPGVPLGARVLVDEGRRAGEADREDVVPAVAVEVVDPGEEVVGVPFAVLRLRRVDLVLLLELRPREPVGAVHDVDVAVPIQVAGADAFGVVLVRESLAIERVDDEVPGLGQPERARGQDREEDGRDVPRRDDSSR